MKLKFLKSITKEWKIALLVLVGILFLGAFLRIYKLDNLSLKADEHIGVRIAYGHNQTGEWKFWDWNKQELTDQDYTRGQVYYWQVSKLMDFVAPTEFNFRLISVFWGIIGIISMFFVSYFYSRNLIIALLTAFLWAISISAITFDRHLRMYSMFAPVYLILSVFVYQFLETLPSKNKNFLEKFSQKTQLNWYYFIPAFLLLTLSFATHFLTINIFPVIAIYILIFAIYEWKKTGNPKNKYSLLLLLPLIALILLSALGYLKSASSFLGFMENNFGHYSNIMTDYSHWLLAITFFAFGSFSLIKKFPKKNTWLALSFLVPFLSAIFIWDRSSGPQYIYLIQTFQTIIIAAGIYFITKKIADLILPKKWYQFFQKTNSRKISLTIGLILYFLILLYNFNFFSENEHFYGEKRKWTHSNYKEVFAYYLKHREENALLITRDFRNYYYAGANIPVYDFGGENKPEAKLTLEKLKSLESENQHLWLVINTNDYDYIKGKARDYIKENYQSIETTYTNDSMLIWKKPNSIK
jgi:hypothetical protein